MRYTFDMSPVGLLYAIGAAFTWGLVYTIDQKLLKGFSPLTLLFVDSALTALLLMPVAFLEKDLFPSLKLIPVKLWLLALFSLALAALANFFIYSSIRILGASLASVFEILYPFFVTLFAYIAFGSEISVFFVVGAAFIFVGSAIIIALA